MELGEDIGATRFDDAAKCQQFNIGFPVGVNFMHKFNKVGDASLALPQHLVAGSAQPAANVAPFVAHALRLDTDRPAEVAEAKAPGSPKTKTKQFNSTMAITQAPALGKGDGDESEEEGEEKS